MFGICRISDQEFFSGEQCAYYEVNGERLYALFDGAIYNYKQLHSSVDLPLKTDTAAEIVAALLSYQDVETVCRSLNGMFSLAVWNDTRKRLICGRDRFGGKPFYYSLTEKGELVFASALSAIIASGLVAPTLSLAALSQYLTLRYIPETACIYKNIKVLEPGSYLIWENGRMAMERYWQLPKPFAKPPSIEEAAEELKLLTRQAIARCLDTKSEVGLLLSGGLDSSTIAALASETKKFRAFSFGIEEKDERPYARAVAERYSLPIYEFTDNSLDIPALMLATSKAYGEPFADPSVIPTWLLYQKASEQVKTVLGGDGADELMGGYDYWYQPLLSYTGKRTFFKKESVIVRRHWADLVKFKTKTLHKLGLPAVLPNFPSMCTNTVDDAMRMDLIGFLPSDCLRKVDRTAAAHGLEIRAPFLDVELAEFLIPLPPEYKVSPDSVKIIMRKAFEPLWPKIVCNRSKQGFGHGTGVWMRQPVMQDFIQYYLGSGKSKIYELFSPNMLKRYAVKSGPSTWCMLILAVWLEHFQWQL